MTGPILQYKDNSGKNPLSTFEVLHDSREIRGQAPLAFLILRTSSNSGAAQSCDICEVTGLMKKVSTVTKKKKKEKRREEPETKGNVALA